MIPLGSSPDSEINMQFGRLAGNDAINTRIYECFTVIDSRDAATFAQKFRRESDAQLFHTFRELVCGTELFRRGLEPRYEQPLGGLTPDWTIYGEDRVAKEIIDVVSLRPRYQVEKDIAKTLGRGQAWAGWVTTAPDRLYQKLQDKFGAYSTFAERERLAFVVALFSEFMAPIDTGEIDHVVNYLYGGLFRDYPQVSGVIHFEQSMGTFRFSAISNASATIKSVAVSKFV
jgi:hypothetical protein